MSSYMFPKQTGGDTIPYPAGSALAAGDVVVVGGQAFGVSSAIPASVAGNLFGPPNTVVRVAHSASGVAIARGQHVWYDTAANEATIVPTATCRSLGMCVTACAATDTFVEVALGTGNAQDAPIELGATTALTLTEADSGRTITNLGGSATATITLPSAPRAGIRYTFIACTDNDIRVDPGDNDAIYMLPSGGTYAKQADGKYARLEAFGDRLIIESNSAGDWVTLDQTAAILIQA